MLYLRHRNLFSLIAILMGVAAFFMIVGHRALDPTNIAWLANGDPAQHYLGWAFFRESPWTLPIGLNPGYGLELSNSIVYSDSNPLFALVFKTFADLLPHPFQYFGFWLLICFILQAYFGWLLSGLMTTKISQRLAVTGFFIFTPPIFLRVLHHLSLSGHFLLLASIYLLFSRVYSLQFWRWFLLLSCAAMVHPYLLLMVGLLWIASLMDRFFIQDNALKSMVVEPISLFIWISFLCWLVGYFSVKSGVGAYGYGFYRWNLVSFYDSDSNSFLLPDLPTAAGDYEGYSYLGLGLIFISFIAFIELLSRPAIYFRKIAEFPYLVIVLMLLAVFSMSNNIGIGAWNLSIPINDKIQNILSVFRASGRMIWPFYYAFVFLILYIAIRFFKKSIVVSVVLWGMLAAQIIDLSPVWFNLRKSYMVERSSVWGTDLINPAWQNLSSKYQSVRRLQLGNLTEHWRLFADYAAKNRMTTDSVYLARIDEVRALDAQNSARQMMSKGSYDKTALYILTDQALDEAFPSLDFYNDTLALLDGFYVLAPNLNKLNGDIDPSLVITEKMYVNRKVFRFGDKAPDSKLLKNGWTHSKNLGAWSDEAESTIDIPTQGAQSHIVLLNASTNLGPQKPNQTINFYENDILLKSATMFVSDNNLIQVVLPAINKKNAGVRTLRLRVGSPNESNAIDPKAFGVGLKSIYVY